MEAKINPDDENPNSIHTDNITGDYDSEADHDNDYDRRNRHVYCCRRPENGVSDRLRSFTI
jgi:hypothetical protein